MNSRLKKFALIKIENEYNIGKAYIRNIGIQ
jgi:hypothetical protein